MSKRRQQKTVNTASDVILVRAEAEHVQSLRPAEFGAFIYNLKCTRCGTLRVNVRFDDSLQEVDGSPCSFNFVMKCRNCGTQSTVSIIGELESVIPDPQEDGEVLRLCCRSCEVESVHCDGWIVESESGTTFNWDATDDFFEYDDDVGAPVTISELKLSSSKAK